MPLPDDFSLSPVATLAHVAESVPGAMHRPFWNHWQERLSACTPRLLAAEPQDPSDPTATHQFASLGSVRIGCALELPPRGVPVRAGLITTHGYLVHEPLEQAAQRWKDLAARGVVVLVLRVRGYPGSQLDVGDWIDTPESLGWITHGFPASFQRPEDAFAWSLPLAVADVACGARALHEWLRSRAKTTTPPPIFLHGESFGGGLAIMAAAQMPADFVRVERLVLGLPTFGDWAWRLAEPSRMAFGAGAHLYALLCSINSPTAYELLYLCDAAIHARHVLVPTLCKLALRDEVVPAPAAAAVYNALGTDPGHKWRFLVPEGHTEPSIACARRHALFVRCMIDFLDPTNTPAEAMIPWEPVFGRRD